MKVIPLAGSTINWREMLVTFRDNLALQPTRRLDAKGVTIGSFDSYLMVLAYLQNPTGPDPATLMQESEELYGHLFFSFIVCCSEAMIFKILQRTTLKVTSTNNTVSEELLNIVSGTLLEWYAATRTFCVEDEDSELRRLFDAFVLFFEKAGLKACWQHLRKKPQQDKTYTLEEMK